MKLPAMWFSCIDFESATLVVNLSSSPGYLEVSQSTEHPYAGTMFSTDAADGAKPLASRMLHFEDTDIMRTALRFGHVQSAGMKELWYGEQGRSLYMP
jgi:hypothetical protein